MFVILFRMSRSGAAVADGGSRRSTCRPAYYATRIQPRVVEVRHLESLSCDRARGDGDDAGDRCLRSRAPRVAVVPPQGEQAVAAVDLTVRQTMFSLIVTMTTAVAARWCWRAEPLRAPAPLTPGELLVVMGYVASLSTPLEQISNTVSGLQLQFITLRGTLRLLDTDPEIHERPDARRSAPRPHRLRRRDLLLCRPPGHPGRCLLRCTAGHAGRHRRADRRRQEHAPEPDPTVLRSPARPRALDGRDVRDHTLARCGHRSAWCCRSRCCSRARSATTSATGSSTPATNGWWRRRWPPTPTTSSPAAHAYDTVIGERGARLSGGERSASQSRGRS